MEDVPEDSEHVSEDSCPPLQRRSRAREAAATEAESAQLMPPPSERVSSSAAASSQVLPARRSLSFPSASSTLPSVSVCPIPPASTEVTLSAPISSTTTPPISVPLPQPAPILAPTSAPAATPSVSRPAREPELSVDDYPAPSDDNVFFSSGRSQSDDAFRWENQGDAFVEPFTLADCCHQLRHFISLGLTGDPPMPPWELRYLTRLIQQKFPNLPAEDATRLAEMDRLLEQVEMTCIASRPTREYYVKSAQDALAKLEGWKESQRALVADRARLLDSRQAQMQSISSLRAQIAELQRVLEQQLKAAEELDMQLAEVDSRMAEVPSSARIEINRMMAEDRLSDGLKAESDLQTLWSARAPILEMNIPNVPGAEGMIPSSQDSIYGNLICFRVLDSITNTGVAPTEIPVAEAEPSQPIHQPGHTVEPSVASEADPTADAVPSDRPTMRSGPPADRSPDTSATPPDEDEVFLNENIEF